MIVIDQRNHHLFQPLLHQVATAGVSPADIAAPIRGILLRRQANTRVVLGAVTDIDRDGRAALIGERRIRDRLKCRVNPPRQVQWSYETIGCAGCFRRCAPRRQVSVRLKSKMAATGSWGPFRSVTKEEGNRTPLRLTRRHQA